MPSPHGWLTGGVLVLTLTAGAETPAAQAHANQKFDYYSFDATTDATATSAQGINARGEIVGSYIRDGLAHGFLWSEDALTTIDYPGALYSDARGINSQGDIVGSYRMPGEPAVNAHGYLLSRHGDFSRVDFEGHTNTIPQRITAAGLILGCRHDGDVMSTMRGIMINAKDPSESVDIAAFASMNNGASPDGQLIVGLYTDMAANRGRGYLLYGGTDFVPFNVPGSAFTAAWDVSTSGEVVGVYRDAGNLTHGFVWSSLQFANVDVPGALATRAFGINARGTIVGNYTDTRNKVHGFVAVRRPVN